MGEAVAMAVLLTETERRKAVDIHGVSRTLFEAMVGRPSIAADMIKHEWIFRLPGTDVFDTGDIAAAWARYLNGERPELHPGGGKKRDVQPPRKKKV